MIRTTSTPLDYARKEPGASPHWRWVLTVFVGHFVVLALCVLIIHVVVRSLKVYYRVPYFDRTPVAAAIYDMVGGITGITMILTTAGCELAFIVRIIRKKLPIEFLALAALMISEWMVCMFFLALASYDAYP